MHPFILAAVAAAVAQLAWFAWAWRRVEREGR
jgi:hypothetical protein